MQPNPTVSVLICTRNRADELIHSLRSVLSNCSASFEVVVVDQSDNDETARVVEICRSEIGGRIPVRHIPTDTRGLSLARNLAIAQAQGSIVAFTDDDCTVGKNWVDTIATLFASDPDLYMVYGQVWIPDEYKNRAEIIVPCLYFDTRRELKKGDIFGMGANMAFRKILTEKIGVYDTVLGAGGVFGGGEDFDFTYRAQRARLKIVAEPTLTAIHKSFRLRDHWDKVTYAYGRGDAAFYGKHARCGDAWAKAAIRKRIALYILRTASRIITGRTRITSRTYIHGFLDGLKQSNTHAVDTPRRLYIADDMIFEGGTV
ncbi:MAG: glycosyltransferase [Akkermansiaceae bacterium]|nr:glycosyltransferase [Armatimonadota bacterium]